MDDLHFHDTRHEAITRLAGKLDVLDLARVTGHRDIRQQKRGGIGAAIGGPIVLGRE